MRRPPPAGDPLSPARAELAALILTGLVHVGAEWLGSEALALRLTAMAAAGWIGYLVWRARGGASVWRAWGLRGDNLAAGLRVQGLLVLAGGAGMTVYGLAAGTLALPFGFWVTLALYPLWGLAQQFALQNLLARNIRVLVPREAAVAALAALLFAASHVPRWPLVGLTLLAGLAFTGTYRRAPNLWAAGLAHGILGTLAIYFVSDEDPSLAIWGFLQ